MLGGFHKGNLDNPLVHQVLHQKRLINYWVSKKGASKEEVLKAANQLQKKIHPDMNRDVKTERIKSISK